MPDSPTPSPTPCPDYGLDAPGAVRNLFIAAGAGLLLFLAFATPPHLWSGKLTLGPVSLNLAPMSLGVALASGFMGAWMALDSKYGKVRERERLLDLLTWAGRERAGCRLRARAAAYRRGQAADVGGRMPRSVEGYAS